MSPSVPRPVSRPVLFWLLGSALVLASVLPHWARTALIDPDPFPAAPVHPWSHPATLVEGWELFSEVAGILPEDASYTVHAGGGTEEMELFMLSLALLPDRRALPSSYYGEPLPDVGEAAEWIVAWPCAMATAGELVARLGPGCLLRRGPE